MKNLSRRKFLTATAGVAGTFALGSVARAKPWPSETVRVAVTGVRGRGAEHVKELLGVREVEVAAVCDINPQVTEKPLKSIEDKQGRKPEYYKDFRKMLEDKSIDAVTIATCNHTHSLLAIWALQAGKHVYVEKPVSHNVWEGRKLVEAARKYKKICQAGTQSRSYKGFQDAIQFIRDGKLGKVKIARGLCYNPRPSIGHREDSPVPAGIDYDGWLGPAPERPWNANRFYYNWHWFWDYGNGDLGNQGIHQMDIARWGIGKDELATRVLSVGGRLGYLDDGETPNSQIVYLEFADGAPILFEVRGLETQPYRGAKVGVVFDCEEGSVVFSRSEAVAFDKSGAQLQKFSGTGEHFKNFTDAIISNKPESLNADVEKGHLSSALCHLGNISYRRGAQEPMDKVKPFGETGEAADAFGRFKEHLAANGVMADMTKLQVGKLINVDPKAETIQGDPEASKLLTREYRKPYVVPEKV
jgi:predicted dehydrogenase